MSEATTTIRAEREYTLHYADDSGATESSRATIPAGAEDAQDEAAWAAAKEAAEDWCRDGEWGDAGAAIDVRYWIEDAEYDMRGDARHVTVDIEPNHAALIRAAGGDPKCEHEWTSEGEGGLSENPGVWSVGGTALAFRSHCRCCGLKKREHHTGSQRNPGEHDTVSYEQPETWCAECQSEECTCGQE